MPPGRGLDPGLKDVLAEAFRKAGKPLPHILSASPLSGGSINRAFLLDTAEGPLFCKWNPERDGAFFAAEREGLEALRSAGTSLIIPQILAGGDAGAAEGVLILEYLPPGNTDRKVWEKLGHGLAELHRNTAPRFGFAGDNYCGLTPQENPWTGDWAAFHAQSRIGTLVRRLEASGRWGQGETGMFRRLMDRMPALLDHKPEPSLLHGDLWSGNFLASERGPALIDPAAYFGDREADWAMMTLFGGFPDAVLLSYQESWPLPAGWRDRLPLYQLYHVLNHYLLFGGSYGDQARRIAARHL